MKSIVRALLVALALFGLGAVADAQGGPAAQAPATEAPSSSSSASGTLSTPAGDIRGQVDVQRRETPPPAGTDATRTGDGAALPRSAVTERTTIFGLSPTAAVVLAAALLVVVVLAIVAMTRTGDTYIGTNRRL
jgi:hypothetical protein